MLLERQSSSIVRQNIIENSRPNFLPFFKLISNQKIGIQVGFLFQIENLQYFLNNIAKARHYKKTQINKLFPKLESEFDVNNNK